MQDIANEFKGQGYGKLKGYVANVVCDCLKDIQSKYNEIIASKQIEKVLADGARKASEVANKTLEDVKDKIGLQIKY